MSETQKDELGARASRAPCLASRQTPLYPEARRETRRPATGTVALPGHSHAPIWRDTACSLEDFSTKGGNCTGHGDHFFQNTKPLQTLMETRVKGLLVKYVFLTRGRKTRLFHHPPPPGCGATSHRGGLSNGPQLGARLMKPLAVIFPDSPSTPQVLRGLGRREGPQ
jgi:hypothetical protein